MGDERSACEVFRVPHLSHCLNDLSGDRATAATAHPARRRRVRVDLAHLARQVREESVEFVLRLCRRHRLLPRERRLLCRHGGARRRGHRRQRRLLLCRPSWRLSGHGTGPAQLTEQVVQRINRRRRLCLLRLLRRGSRHGGGRGCLLRRGGRAVGSGCFFRGRVKAVDQCVEVVNCRCWFRGWCWCWHWFCGFRALHLRRGRFRHCVVRS